MATREDLCIAMDLGGTKMRVALIDRTGDLIQRDSEPTLANQSREQTLERLTSIITRLVSSTGDRKLVGIVASLASLVDPVTGTMNNPPNLPGWDNFSLKPLLEATFNLPFWAANDATLGAIGEHACGIGQGISNLLYITVSTGIGGGIIVNGSPFLGSRGFAGELGHMSIDRNGPSCACGNRGCLEMFASGTAIARFARERLENGETSLILEMAGKDITNVNSKMVMEAADRRDPLGVELIEQFARDLGLGLVNLIHIFDPQMIIIGGGVSQSSRTYSAALDATIRSNVIPHLKEHINVVTSVLGDDASLLGAATLAFQRVGRAG